MECVAGGWVPGARWPFALLCFAGARCLLPGGPCFALPVPGDLCPVVAPKIFFGPLVP